MTDIPKVPAGPAVETLDNEQAALFSAAERTLQELEAQLVADDPDIRSYLREINQQLRQFPELLYLLQPSQRSAIYRGLIAVSEIEIVKVKAKKAGKAHVMDNGKSVLDMLGD